ncbi:MAG: tRNA pseudouridine(55) synthase, partial [Bacteroidota bacterium]
TGLLILCTGKMTKQLERFQAEEKEYEATFTIGKTTPSYDLETEFDSDVNYHHVTQESMDKAIKELTGHLMQTPPVFSAIKKGGVPSYKKARRKEEVKLDPRPVEIKEFEIISTNLPEVNVRIVCSKGTYIRSLAHDFGQKIGVGAYLSRLVRTRIGEHKLSGAWQLETFVDRINSQQ